MHKLSVEEKAAAIRELEFSFEKAIGSAPSGLGKADILEALNEACEYWGVI